MRFLICLWLMAKKQHKNTNNKTINVGLISLGCPKNTVDSEAMLGRIAHCGYTIVGDINIADVVIVNTCGFIAPAKQEAVDQLKDVAKYKDNGRLKLIIAAGCLAQRMGEKLKELVPQIDIIVGLAERDRIDEIIYQNLEDINHSLYLSENNSFIADDRGRLLTTPGHYAYLRISEGCDRRCAFCTIPDIRGPFRSKPIKDIAREAEELAKYGVKELVIIAQETNNYGKDIGIAGGLIELLSVLENFSFEWIRVMYMYPAAVTDELIAKIAASKKILPYIDIPIQHINNDILKSMRRVDTKEKTTALIEKLRAAMPDIVLRTTIITGYPGETDAQHQELVEFIKWAKFDALGCFTYFPEEGTTAAALDGQIPQEVKDKRLDEIMTTQQEIVFAKNEAMIGREFNILIDRICEDGSAEGRYYGQAPEIDSLCIIEKCKSKAGRLIKARVEDYCDYDLVVKQIL